MTSEKVRNIRLVKLAESRFITDVLCTKAGLNARQIYTPIAIDIFMTKRLLTI